KARARAPHLPPAARLGEEHAFGRLDPVEHAVADPHAAARHHHARARVSAELLLVLVALLVAVEDLRHRSMSPIHDPHAVLDAGGAPEAEVAFLTLLAQAQMGEVGRERIDFGTRARAPQLLEQRTLAVPLIGQRQRVLALAARDDLLAQSLELALEPPLVRARLLAALLEVLPHARVERDLLVDDAIGQAGPRPDVRKGPRG